MAATRSTRSVPRPRRAPGRRRQPAVRHSCRVRPATRRAPGGRPVRRRHRSRRLPARRQGRRGTAVRAVRRPHRAGVRDAVRRGRVAILSVGHRLASRTELRLADLEHETLPRWKGVPDGGSGPEIVDAPQMIHLIKLGRTIAVLPRSLVEPVPPGAGVRPGDRRDDQPPGRRMVAAQPPVTRLLVRRRGGCREHCAAERGLRGGARRARG
jgi:hypothetical protein